MSKSTVLLALTIAIGSSSALAFKLDIPASERKLLAKIEEACPGCSKKPMIACGDRDVGYGKKFYPHFFQGKPAMGYLIVAPERDLAYRNIRDGFELVAKDRAKGEAALKKAYAHSTLLAVAKSDGSVTAILPERIQVSLPDAFLPCLKERAVSCPEKIDPPELSIYYGDASRPQDQIKLRLTFHGFDNKLYRPVGKLALVYFCYNEGRATLN